MSKRQFSPPKAPPKPPHLFLSLELIPVSEPPDDDTTVLLFNEAWDDQTITGWKDGDLWRENTAEPLEGVDKPTHWAHLPALEDAVEKGAAK